MQHADSVIRLLEQLIAIPSFSKEEDNTALVIFEFLNQNGVAAQRKGNNVWARNKFFNSALPTILLNSHHDTVKPNPGYTRDPFAPKIEDGKLFGLGSNDAGGPLVSLIATFLHFYPTPGLRYNFNNKKFVHLISSVYSLTVHEGQPARPKPCSMPDVLRYC